MSELKEGSSDFSIWMLRKKIDKIETTGEPVGTVPRVQDLKTARCIVETNNISSAYATQMSL